ncbi:putative cyclin domain-containing protein [Helianthus annuus]|uniref:Cyclin n=1 Tax=Helianthus annuus TaxID=4232 RepID=A0A251TH02_HELAN|nr:cyclin-D5-1 [Helianthus annuus]KAF5769631.1 putative cyclin [Helianthus annuus]KAJ0464610.1 putative cyclin domain-containing protein [Helianthus annuus]KAJ0469228.1 putative cyclin domain-containing protein [Helianthus annuus]KAJ0486208.1 putative cyclin domain-containing protein [Helianthus annuus]KAJ0656757.1 putative cyclin domain-containing protein [Helianthus annuus]
MDPDTTFSLPNLMCEEDDSSSTQVKIKISQPRSDDDRYIRLLIDKETKSNDYGCVCVDEISRNSLKCARLDTVNWIFSIREILGFNFRTVYLSLTYFDRFNSKRLIDSGKEWAIQLLGIACLSLAAKMEEQTIPTLPHYKAQGYNFENSVIQRMELLVLTTLEWKMCGITPFAYLHYFVSKICDECDRNELLVSKAIGFVLDFSKEVNSMDHRPSVVAIAAVLLACDDQLTRSTLECKIGVVSSLHSLDKECIYRCYNLLKELVIKKNHTPDSNSYDLLRNYRKTSSSIGIKRKLTYNGIEQKCPLQKTSRRL